MSNTIAIILIIAGSCLSVTGGFWMGRSSVQSSILDADDDARREIREAYNAHNKHERHTLVEIDGERAFIEYRDEDWAKTFSDLQDAMRRPYGFMGRSGPPPKVRFEEQADD